MSAFAAASRPATHCTPRRRLKCIRMNAKSSPEPNATGEDETPSREDLERIFKKSPSRWPTEEKYEEKVLDDIQSEGLKDIKSKADELQNELEQLSTEDYAKELVNDEMDKVLKRFKATQEDFLTKQKTQVEEIRKEAQLIQELASSVENPSTNMSKQETRQKVLLALSAVFGLSAVFYFWNGATDLTGESSTLVRNAALNGVVAALFAYFSGNQTGRKERDDEKI